MHALKSTNDRNENLNLTVSKLEHYNNYSQKIGYPLKLVLENNRRKGIVDPGDDWDDVMNIVNLSGIAGACFDFGHYYYNMKHFNDNPLYLPQTDDLRIVKHTHIHGLVNEVTHFPLTDTDLPINNYVNALNNANYKGIYNLEISHSHFLDKIDSLNALIDSVFLLRSAIISSYSS